MKMRNLLLAATAIAASAGGGVASAADLSYPQAPVHEASVPVASTPFNWSGIYFGVNGGYGLAPTNTVDTLTGNSSRYEREVSQ